MLFSFLYYLFSGIVFVDLPHDKSRWEVVKSSHKKKALRSVFTLRRRSEFEIMERRNGKNIESAMTARVCKELFCLILCCGSQ